MKREKALHNLSEMIHHCIVMYHTSHAKASFSKKLRIFSVEDELFKNLMFANPSEGESLIFVVFKIFLAKIEYHLENKTLFSSAYCCGQLFNFLCQNIDFFIDKKEDRIEFARRIREYMSDICRLVNISHTLFRFREENDEVKLPAGLVRRIFLEY